MLNVKILIMGGKVVNEINKIRQSIGRNINVESDHEKWDSDRHSERTNDLFSV